MKKRRLTDAAEKGKAIGDETDALGAELFPLAGNLGFCLAPTRTTPAGQVLQWCMRPLVDMRTGGPPVCPVPEHH